MVSAYTGYITFHLACMFTASSSEVCEHGKCAVSSAVMLQSHQKSSVARLAKGMDTPPTMSLSNVVDSGWGAADLHGVSLHYDDKMPHQQQHTHTPDAGSQTQAIPDVGNPMHSEGGLHADVATELPYLWNAWHLLGCASFTVYCICYELSFPSRQSNGKSPTVPFAASPACRDHIWDIMKFLLIWTVVVFHWPTCSSHWMEPFFMGGFALISGIFGASVSSASTSRMLCATLGCCVIATLIKGPLQVLLAGKDLHIVPTFDGKLWYLESLCVWRLTITPLFHFSREKLGMPSCIPLAFTITTSLVLINQHIMTFWFGIYFAIGLSLPPKAWRDILLHKGTLIFALVVLAFYYTQVYNTSLNAWKGGDLPVLKMSTDTPRNTASFLHDLWMVGACTSMTVASLCIAAHISSALAELAPGTQKFLAGCGSRSLYTYLLHGYFWEAVFRLGPDHVQTFEQSVAMLAFAMAINVLLSSRGTEFIFNVLLVPRWMTDMLEAAACRMGMQGSVAAVAVPLALLWYSLHPDLFLLKWVAASSVLIDVFSATRGATRNSRRDEPGCS